MGSGSRSPAVVVLLATGLLTSLGGLVFLGLEAPTQAPDPRLESSGPAVPAPGERPLLEARAAAPAPDTARAAPARRPPTPPSPLLTAILEDHRPYEELVAAARQYFDLGVEPWRARATFLAELGRHATQGRIVLRDMDALRWLIAQSRSFEPPFDDRRWQRAQGVTRVRTHGKTLHHLRSQELDVSYSVPGSYPRARQLERRLPRPAPYPLLLAVHTPPPDAGAAAPGSAFLNRIHPAVGAWRDLYRDWLVLAPHAPEGGFLDARGRLRGAGIQGPFAQFWKHYHVDFDRVVLEGGADAFAAATSIPVFFAGIVLRGGGWALSDTQRAQVRNFAPVPVYVVEDARLARDLRAAGHPDVTSGAGDGALLAWMRARRRVSPQRFAWTAARIDQVLPYWINLDHADWEADERTLTVDVVDTEEEPNTIRIDAAGINRLSLYLNDDLVDLDRAVRVVVNGHVEHDEILGPSDARMDAVGRDLDFLFNREPLRIRTSRYFGWLTPARLAGIAVQPPRLAPTPAAVVGPTPEPALVDPTVVVPGAGEAGPDLAPAPPEPEDRTPWIVLLAVALLGCAWLLARRR